MIAFLGVISVFCTLIFFVGFLIQCIKKKPRKRTWGLYLACSVTVFAICFAITPVSDKNETDTNQNVNVSEQTNSTDSVSEHTENEINQERSTAEEKEATEAEKFSQKNKVSLELAESLESVLEGIELTDKSKVGVFHYDLTDIYEWKQIDDWAYGERYSGYMDMEHIFYFYVTDNTVVGVRDGHGNIFYTAD